jgi:hypothetical protein
VRNSSPVIVFHGLVQSNITSFIACAFTIVFALSPMLLHTRLLFILVRCGKSNVVGVMLVIVIIGVMFPSLFHIVGVAVVFMLVFIFVIGSQVFRRFIVATGTSVTMCAPPQENNLHEWICHIILVEIFLVLPVVYTVILRNIVVRHSDVVTLGHHRRHLRYVICF